MSISVLVTWALRLVTAAGLAVDAYIHADLAHRYDPNQGDAVISQGDLFRIEAGVAALVALLILLSARAVVWAAALVVAASALGALLLSLNYDGAIGPLPNMYEPTTYPEKTMAAVAEGIAAVVAAAGLGYRLLVSARTARRRSTRPVGSPVGGGAARTGRPR